MSTTTSDDAPHPYAERPTVADNGFIRPSGTSLSTPYLCLLYTSDAADD